jgi:hypothetical protein
MDSIPKVLNGDDDRTNGSYCATTCRLGHNLAETIAHGHLLSVLKTRKQVQTLHGMSNCVKLPLQLEVEVQIRGDLGGCGGPEAQTKRWNQFMSLCSEKNGVSFNAGSACTLHRFRVYEERVQIAPVQGTFLNCIRRRTVKSHVEKFNNSELLNLPIADCVEICNKVTYHRHESLNEKPLGCPIVMTQVAWELELPSSKIVKIFTPSPALNNAPEKTAIVKNLKSRKRAFERLSLLLPSNDPLFPSLRVDATIEIVDALDVLEKPFDNLPDWSHSNVIYEVEAILDFDEIHKRALSWSSVSVFSFQLARQIATLVNHICS